jgi:hypothetical protein
MALKLGIVVVCGVIGMAIEETYAREAYEAYYMYTTDINGLDYPHGAAPSWGNDDNLTNGVAHDYDNWYFTALGTHWDGTPDDTWRIWQIPVAEALDQDFSGNPGVSVIGLVDVPALLDARYGHAGDLDHCDASAAAGYLLVPFTGYPLRDANGIPIPGTEPPPAIGFFQAGTLGAESFVNYATIPGQGGGAGWCATDASGYVYSSNNHTDTIRRYEVNWPLLWDTSRHDALTYEQDYGLESETGESILLHHMQGGEFTESGELLYVNCGIWCT